MGCDCPEHDANTTGTPANTRTPKENNMEEHQHTIKSMKNKYVDLHHEFVQKLHGQVVALLIAGQNMLYKFILQLFARHFTSGQ